MSVFIWLKADKRVNTNQFSTHSHDHTHARLVIVSHFLLSSSHLCLVIYSSKKSFFSCIQFGPSCESPVCIQSMDIYSSFFFYLKNCMQSTGSGTEMHSVVSKCFILFLFMPAHRVCCIRIWSVREKLTNNILVLIDRCDEFFPGTWWP